MQKCIYIICYSFKALLCLRGFNNLKRINCFQEWGLPDNVKGCLSAKVCSICCQVNCILYVDHHCKYGSKNCSFQHVWSMYIFTAEFAVICWKLYGAEFLIPPFWCEYSRSFAYLGVWTCVSDSSDILNWLLRLWGRCLTFHWVCELRLVIGYSRLISIFTYFLNKVR